MTDSTSTPQTQPNSISNPLRVTLLALLVGLSVDVLFYNKAVGISFPIFVALCIAVLVTLVFLEQVSFAFSSLWLAVPLLIFAGLVYIRAEPLTTLANILITFGLGALLVRTIYHGRLFRFGLIDYVANYVLLGLEMCLRPFPFMWEVSKQVSDKENGRRFWLPILRGLILATPILCLFALLLSAADLVFADRLRDILKWLNLDNIPELIFRGILILMATFAALGLLVQALNPFRKYGLIGEEKSVVPAFLGLIESGMVLGGINLLFGAFVVIQFRYLFGSTANITETGYTYSEYARRGFGELVLVVMLTLGILLTLSTVVRRSDRNTVVVFNVLNFILVALVGVMVISALQRLLLYESIFGFSRLRTYAHVAVIWLGLLFVPYLVALLAGRLRWFATGALLVVLGFGATLNGINVDKFIAQQNLNRTEKLHANYLITLSDDAMPEMLSALKYNDASVVNVVGAGLSCRLKQMNEQSKTASWQSANLARSTAFELLRANEKLLGDWAVDKQNQVLVNGKVTPCRQLLQSFVLEPGLTSEYR